MQNDTIKWLASIFRPFIISVLNEPSRVDFASLLKKGGGANLQRNTTLDLTTSNSYIDTSITGIAGAYGGGGSS